MRLTDKNEVLVPKRINWAPIIMRMQKGYDVKYCYSSKIRRVRKQTYQVRGRLVSLGRDQSRLKRNNKALDVEGVIYVIYSLRTSFLYVGQTIGSASERYKKHVNKAHDVKSDSYNTPLSNFIRSQGYSHLYIAPLELIPKSLYSSANREREVSKFKELADPREMFWINNLHSYIPKGLNVKGSERLRIRRHQGKPMIWRRNSSLSAISNLHVDVHKRLYASRDYTRRVNHVVSMAIEGTLSRIRLHAYLPGNLWKMYRQAMVLGANANQNAPIHTVITFLKDFLFTRQFSKKIDKQEDGPLMRILWQTKTWQHIPLRRILNLPNILNLLPEGIEFPDNVIISRKLIPTIASKIYNFSKVARNLPPLDSLPEGVCVCQHLFSEKYRNHDSNCVYTGDIAIVENTALRTIISMGSRFRTRVAANPIDALETGLDEFINAHLTSSHVSVDKFTQWKTAIITRAKKMIHSAEKIKDTSVIWSSKCARYLRFLQTYLVLTPVDKANTNTSLICKNLYISILHRELQTGGAYTFAPKTVSAKSILDSHRVFLSKHRLEMSNTLTAERALGYLYFIPKLHKLHCAQRFICGMSECTTTKLSKALSSIFDCILLSLRSKDNHNLLLTGIRRFFVVKSYEEVASFLHKWPRTVNRGQHRLYTGDFSTMYTTIPHDDLYDRICDSLREAWTWEMKNVGCDDINQLQLLIHSDKSHTWHKVSARGEHLFVTATRGALDFSFKAIQSLLHFMIVNTYVMNGGVIKRQTVGMPMGTNCAPNLANLYLYSYESTYIDRLTLVKGEKIAKLFHMSFRLIDDTLSIDNPYWKVAVEQCYDSNPGDGVGGMYPAALTLNNTTVVPNKEITFLGMRVRDRKKKLFLSVFDKRTEFPFRVLRYPYMCSVIPTSIPYGVLTGQLYRFHRICSHWTDFVNDSRKVVKILMIQGCLLPLLVRKIMKFLHVRRSETFQWRGVSNIKNDVMVKRISSGLGKEMSKIIRKF